MTESRRKQIATLQALLAERFPLAFPADKEAIQPLKVGLRKDIDEALKGFPAVSKSVLHEALATWCQRPRYFAALVQGGGRIDMEGNPAGEVSPEDQAKAKARLEAFWKAHKPKAAPTPAPAVPAEPAEPKTPSRFGRTLTLRRVTA